MMNRLCKLRLITLCVVIIVEHVVCRSVGVKKQECYGDICNKWSDDQFCSDIFKMCRNCAEVVKDCGTKNQPQECFQFCVSHYAKLEQEREKNSTCSLPRLANGMVNTSNINTNGRVTIHSNVTFSCHTGFTLEGVVSKRCLGNDAWTDEDTPICNDNSNIVWKTIGITSIVLFLLLLALSIILIIVLKRKTKQGLTKTSTSNGGHEIGGVDDESELDETRALLNKNTIFTVEKDVESAKQSSSISQSPPPPPPPPPSSSSTTTTTSTATTATITQITAKTTIATASSSSPAIEKNTNHCVNGCQAVGNNVNVTLFHMLPGGDLINTDTGLDNKENKNAQNDGQEPVKSPTKDTTVTEESQETVEAFQETQGTRLRKAAETEENAPLTDNNYARQKPNLVGYNDRAFVATGSSCKTQNCPNG